MRRAFSQPSLRYLFGDYLTMRSLAVLRFAPIEDERFFVVAKLGVPSPGINFFPPKLYRPAAAGMEPVGSVTMRYQPKPDMPFTFLDMKARVGGQKTRTTADMRGCYFNPSLNTAAFAILPLFPDDQRRSSSLDALRLGMRYTSSNLSVGFIASPWLGSGTIRNGKFAVPSL